MTPEQLAQRLLEIEDRDEQRRLLVEHKVLVSPALMNALKAAVDGANLRAPQQALRMASVSLLAADVAGDELCHALALWTKSHPLMMLEDYAGGLILCDEALALCQRYGHEWEAARVQVSRMFALINLGRFDEAIHLGESTKPVLEQRNDLLFLARLEMNAGVACDFADRYEEALAAYERARERFAALGNTVQVARIDMNRAIAYENLDRFDEALDIYQRIRDFFLQQGTMLEVARADFNMAILHFRQGQYDAALSRFQKAYEGFRTLNVTSEMDQVVLYSIAL
jgi:tetratricopeptide (TPR) repeat protein